MTCCAMKLKGCRPKQSCEDCRNGNPDFIPFNCCKDFVPVSENRKWRVYVGVRVKSEANLRDAWFVRHKRAKTQKQCTLIALIRDMGAQGQERKGRYRIRPIRLKGHGQRDFDSDNLWGSFKAVRDQVASYLGIDDGSNRLEFLHPIQRKPERGESPGVILEIEEI